MSDINTFSENLLIRFSAKTYVNVKHISTPKAIYFHEQAHKLNTVTPKINSVSISYLTTFKLSRRNAERLNVR